MIELYKEFLYQAFTWNFIFQQDNLFCILPVLAAIFVFAGSLFLIYEHRNKWAARYLFFFPFTIPLTIPIIIIFILIQLAKIAFLKNEE